MPRWQWGVKGLHIFWACRDSKGANVVWSGFSCLHANCSNAVLAAADKQITRASAKVATANALWDQHVKFDCNVAKDQQTEIGALCRERKAIFARRYIEWTR